MEKDARRRFSEVYCLKQAAILDTGVLFCDSGVPAMLLAVEEFLRQNKTDDLLRVLFGGEYPTDAAIAQKVSDHYVKLGHIDKAKTLWERYLKWPMAQFDAILAASRREDNRSEEYYADQPAPKEYYVKANRTILGGWKNMVLPILAGYEALLREHGSEAERAALAAVKQRVEAEKLEPKRKLPVDPRPMTLDTFWALIEESRPDDGIPATHARQLTERLLAFKASDIAKFNKLLYEKLDEAYRYDLWAVAYLAMGGCSDDAFTYLRCWLVLQGRDTFTRVLAKPERLADGLSEAGEMQAEELLEAAASAYVDKRGQDLPNSAFPKPAAQVQGEPWTESDLQRLYPMLCKKLGFKAGG
jgi:hypothetical protein